MELTQEQQIKQKIAELQEQLLTAHPQLPVLLRSIHTELLKDKQLVQALTEDEIATIVNGLKRQTQTNITVTAKKTSGKSLKNVSLDDL